MSNYDNTNRGAIFKNDHKTEEKHPDYRGTINVEGADKQISLWVKTSKEGKKYFSASISEPYKKEASKHIEEKIPLAIDTEEDDLPW